MYERRNVPLNFLVQRMRIIILKKTESMTGISAITNIMEARSSNQVINY